MPRIFISCVTGEFGGYRVRLATDLRSAGADCVVKIQEEFNQTAHDTIEKLDKYLCSCDSFIQILGEGSGAVADPVAIEEFLAKEPGFVEAMKQHGDFRTLPLSYTMWEAFLAAYRGKNIFVYRASVPIRNGQPTKADGFEEDWPVFVPGPNERALVDQHCERLMAFRPRRYPTRFKSLDDLNRMFLRGLQEILNATPTGALLPPQWLTIPDRQWSGTPGALLRADHAIVPFHGRENELAAWKTWITAEASPGVRVLTASGGIGKTRLARELCIQLRADGVSSGFLDPSESDACLAYLRQAADDRMLVVIDYAETAEQQITDILQLVIKRNLRSLGLLLLARGPGHWLRRLARASHGVGEFFTREPESLRPLAMGLEARWNSYHLALHAFADKLGRDGSVAEPPDVSAPYYDRTLLLHMSALLAVEGQQPAGMDPILDSVLGRECANWAAQLQHRQLPQVLEPGFERAMGIICGYGGVKNKPEAVEVIGRIRFFSDQPRAVIEAVADVLHDCYPGPPWIEPIQPDLLQEYLVAKATAANPDDFLNIVLPGGKDGHAGFQ